MFNKIVQSLCGGLNRREARRRRATRTGSAVLRLRSLRSLRSGAGLFLFIGIWLLTSCTLPSDMPATPADFVLVTDAPTQMPSPTAFSPQTATPSLTPTPTPSPTLTATAQPTLVNGGRTQYILETALDYDTKTLAVKERIQYTNHSSDALTSLMLAVDPNRWSGCFNLQITTVNGHTVTPNIESMRMEIPLETPLVPNETVIIEMAYSLNIPVKQPKQVFGYDGNWQINLVNWYPFIAPYDAEDGWLLHSPSGVGEHLVYEIADFDVIFNVSAEEDVVVAASASTEPQGNTYRYQLEGARTFVFSISSAFSTETVSSENGDVTSFYFPNYAKPGEAILNAGARALEIYSRRYAPYPHEHLSIVQTYLPDGMEYDGLIFMGTNFYDEYDGTLKNNLIALGVHEISHQWFFGLVGSDQALEPWLDESLALYSERIFYEETPPYPVTWWWQWRVNWFKPSGWVDRTIYTDADFRNYTNATYLRGALFLEELRQRVGEEAFNNFLQDYVATYTDKIATGNDFFATLDQHTNVDYSDIVDEYFLNR